MNRKIERFCLKVAAIEAGNASRDLQYALTFLENDGVGGRHPSVEQALTWAMIAARKAYSVSFEAYKACVVEVDDVA